MKLTRMSLIIYILAFINIFIFSNFQLHYFKLFVYYLYFILFKVSFNC